MTFRCWFLNGQRPLETDMRQVATGGGSSHVGLAPPQRRDNERGRPPTVKASGRSEQDVLIADLRGLEHSRAVILLSSECGQKEAVARESILPGERVSVLAWAVVYC